MNINVGNNISLQTKGRVCSQAVSTVTSLWFSVTRNLGYLLSFWPFTAIIFAQWDLKFAKIISKFGPILNEPFQNGQSFFNGVPKWKIFDNSGHTAFVRRLLASYTNTLLNRWQRLPESLGKVPEVVIG